MAYITSVCFFVLINDLPTNLFKVGRGLRQGFSLSPLIFFPIMDGMSLKIKEAQGCGCFYVLNITNYVNIMLLFFMDDILTFGIISKEQSTTLHYIFTRYGATSGLLTNNSKSTLYFSAREAIEFITGIFRVSSTPLKYGISYLGYKLKPCRYSSMDWLWFADKYKQNISNWTH